MTPDYRWEQEQVRTKLQDVVEWAMDLGVDPMDSVALLREVATYTENLVAGALGISEGQIETCEHGTPASSGCDDCDKAEGGAA